MKDTELAYVAGLMDGEGSICLSHRHKRDKYRCPNVTITSTTRALVEIPLQLFGGCICTHKTYKEHHKPHWSWRLYGNSAIKFCTDIYPWLREPAKAYRAKLIALRYKSVTPRNGKYSKDMHELKLQFEHDFFHPSAT